MKNIKYMIDENGAVYSQVGSEIAFPVLRYEEMNPGNNFSMQYDLCKDSIFSFIHSIFIHTRKVPKAVKNIHRKFWGMKPVTK